MKININAGKIKQVVNADKITINQTKKNKRIKKKDDKLNEHKIKIFLASSNKLLEERRAFEIFISRLNHDYIKQGIYLELVIWENFLDAMSSSRLQDEYNKTIEKCDIFLMLFFSKVGKYTSEEFETAYKAFKLTGKPLIFTYLKDVINVSEASQDEKNSLLKFKKELSSLGHFYTTYNNPEALLLHFSNQLKKINLKKL